MGWLSGGRGGGADKAIEDPKEDDNNDEDIEQQKLQQQQQTPLTPLEEERRDALGQGSYHLPGNPTEPNKWWKDYCQFFRNNHPLLAPCFQDKLHPISKPMRAVGLVGSLMVGLVITNVIFLWFIPNHDETSEDETDVAIFKLSTGGFAIQNGTSVTYYDSQDSGGGSGGNGGMPPEVAAALNDQTTIEYYGSTELIILWTVGSLVHSLFDATIWYATSCSCLTSLDGILCCCFFDKDNDGSDPDDDKNNSNDKTSQHHHHHHRQGPIGRWVNDHRGWCNVLVIMMVVLVTAAATLVVMIRALDEATGGNGSESAQEVWNSVSTSGDPSTGVDAVVPMPTNLEGAEPITDKENYRFLLSYAIELGFAWFVWFPLVETILFSGVLSCRGRNPIPGLGGRPAELRAIRAAEEEEERKRNKRASVKLRKAQKRLSSKTESNPSSSMNRPGQTPPSSPSKKRKSKTAKKSPPIVSKSKTDAGQRRQSNPNPSSTKKKKKAGR